jgi:hypothetical protein
MTAPSRSHFEFLQSIDTPTACNLIEIVAPERRGSGLTVPGVQRVTVRR